jgi:uncharacterized protein (DUF1786 family)
MRLLCVDIGFGTQDVLFIDTSQTVENAIQLVLPSPTALVAKKIKSATARNESLLLTGETMGGGACTQALKEHMKKGCTAYAVPAAALSFSDDLGEVDSWGVKLISPDEAIRLKADTTVRLGDIDLEAFQNALSQWDIQLDPDVVAVAVLDHGIAPHGESQRLSRFRHLESLIKNNNSLEDLIFTSTGLPDYFTRMQAVVRSLKNTAPLVLMDTGAAAVLGASLDRVVAAYPHRLVVNLGNSHAIAFLLNESRILGLFEHHTRQLSLPRLEILLEKLTSGKLSLMEVWEDGGHGSLVLERGETPFLVATGPRRSLLIPSRLNACLAAPFGNMMLAGCFGLVKAVSIKFNEWRGEIESAILT